jgi:hypothetical protein
MIRSWVSTSMTPTSACGRPWARVGRDVRRVLKTGDHIFVVSGKLHDINQFVMGGFEIEKKLDVNEAYRLFPHLRLRKRKDGQLTGNIIVDGAGRQHPLDTHDSRSFEGRVQNYVVGTNPIVLSTPEEIDRGRAQTLDALREILHRGGESPFRVVGRFGANLDERQVLQLRDWLLSLKGSQN